ncbi:DUF7711 family protein [Streptomyces graminilatus]|uniref:DUF7711 family protein n=1 Tax=Streptomyces graminilatus TaxID=1464070 RepID=UPI0006E30D46|nr:hypothetical protein [Streptomyces graminilatus]
MRYATAVRRLRTVADSCTRALVLSTEPPLAAAYVFGPVLDEPGNDVEVVQVAFVLDVPAADLPWGVEPPACSALAERLGVTRAPVHRVWRSADRHVTNHMIRRPLRIWSLAGVDEAALDALVHQQAEPLREDDPAPAQAHAQRESERAESLTHLMEIRDRYHDPDWRRRHRSAGQPPETYLWSALDGFLELEGVTTPRSRGTQE